MVVKQGSTIVKRGVVVKTLCCINLIQHAAS